MANNYNLSETELVNKSFDIFNDMATKNKIYRHLNDINDIISEDDIRNIKVAIPGSENIYVINNIKKDKFVAS